MHKTLWMVFDIGCIECGSDSHVVGVFDSLRAAEAVAERLNETMGFYDGGQHSFEVFPLNHETNEIREPRYREGNNA